MYQADRHTASVEGWPEHGNNLVTEEVRKADNKTDHDQEWEKEQQKRKQLITKTCQKYNLKFSKQRIKGSLLYEPRHKLLYCPHAKVIKMGCPKTEKPRGVI